MENNTTELNNTKAELEKKKKEVRELRNSYWIIISGTSHTQFQQTTVRLCRENVSILY